MLILCIGKKGGMSFIKPILLFRLLYSMRFLEILYNGNGKIDNCNHKKPYKEYHYSPLALSMKIVLFLVNLIMTNPPNSDPYDYH